MKSFVSVDLYKCKSCGEFYEIGIRYFKEEMVWRFNGTRCSCGKLILKVEEGDRVIRGMVNELPKGCLWVWGVL